MDLSQALTRIADLERDLAAKDATLKTANAALQEITHALDAAGAPATYSGGGTEPKPIPTPERIRLLGEQHLQEKAHAIRHRDIADILSVRLQDADRALDDAGAPRLADGTPLSPAARIRALSC